MGIKVELYTKKLKRGEAEKNVEASMKSMKYEKYWAVIVERLIQALKDENKYVRWGAAGALGEMGDERAVEPLIEALEDKDSSVRDVVVWALEKIGDKAGVHPLIKTTKDHENSDDQERAE